MELIIKRLKDLGFEVRICTRMADEDAFFITHIEAHQNGGAYKSAGFVHRTVTPPEQELKSHLSKAEGQIERTVKPLSNELKQIKRNYRKFNEIPLNWVPKGDILNERLHA